MKPSQILQNKNLYDISKILIITQNFNFIPNFKTLNLIFI